MLNLKEVHEICNIEKSGRWILVQGDYYTEICDENFGSRPFAAVTSNDKAKFIAYARTALPETLEEIERLKALTKKLKVENELLKKQCETCGDNDGYITCLKDAQRENTWLREEINTINQRMADVTKENYLLKEELKAAKQIELPR